MADRRGTTSMANGSNVITYRAIVGGLATILVAVFGFAYKDMDDKIDKLQIGLHDINLKLAANQGNQPVDLFRTTLNEMKEVLNDMKNEDKPKLGITNGN